MNFKVGDVVQLKSGGPKMTVIETGWDSGAVMCGWFNNTPGSFEFKQQLLQAGALKFYE